MPVKSFDKFSYLKSLQGAKISSAEFRVLVTILNHANQYGKNAYPSIATLAKECVMSDRNVKRCLGSLRDAGWLHQDKRGRRGKEGDRASEYSLTTPKGQQRPIDLGAKTDDLRDIDGQPMGQNEQTYGTESCISPGNLGDTNVTPISPLEQGRRTGPDQVHAAPRCGNCQQVLNGEHKEVDGNPYCLDCPPWTPQVADDECPF